MCPPRSRLRTGSSSRAAAATAANKFILSLPCCGRRGHLLARANNNCRRQNRDRTPSSGCARDLLQRNLLEAQVAPSQAPAGRSRAASAALARQSVLRRRRGELEEVVAAAAAVARGAGARGKKAGNMMPPPESPRIKSAVRDPKGSRLDHWWSTGERGRRCKLAGG